MGRPLGLAELIIASGELESELQLAKLIRKPSVAFGCA